MNPYLFAVITVRQNLNVMDFYVQLPFSRQSLTVFGKAAPLIRKGTLTFGIYHRPFPTGRQIAGVRAFNTAGIHRQHGRKEIGFVPVTVINMAKGMTGLY